MTRHHVKRSLGRPRPIMLAGLLLAPVALRAQETPNLDSIPKAVMAALKARFPAAEIHKWTREQEGDTVLYDIEFRQGDRKFEADIGEDGAIHNWEREIAAADLPDVVRKAVETRYPNATLGAIMAITAVTDGREALEGYEIVLDAAGKGEVEVTVAPDGKILEDSGDTDDGPGGLGRGNQTLKREPPGERRPSGRGALAEPGLSARDSLEFAAAVPP
jgi:hypothetical protein